MRAYFDTEFTDFKPAHLISIGVVRDDGAEYYAVLTDTWEKSQCNDFVIATVLPLLDEAGHTRSLKEVESDLREFLKDGYSLVCDSMYDWYFVQEIFKEKLPVGCRCVQISIPESTLEALSQTQNLPRHNALNDARILWKADVSQLI